MLCCSFYEALVVTVAMKLTAFSQSALRAGRLADYHHKPMLLTSILGMILDST